MNYRVYIEPPALDDVDAAYLWLREKSVRAADAWLDGLADAVDRIAAMPASFALAPEAAAIGIDIQEMHYGRFPHVYRVFFVVRKYKIHVLHVRHETAETLDAVYSWFTRITQWDFSVSQEHEQPRCNQIR